eukprot:3151500-Lingulodinium_polyedra.AAC.1
MTASKWDSSGLAQSLAHSSVTTPLLCQHKRSNVHPRRLEVVQLFWKTSRTIAAGGGGRDGGAARAARA